MSRDKGKRGESVNLHRYAENTDTKQGVGSSIVAQTVARTLLDFRAYIAR